jgi:ATP-dependent Clp protease ATP-binding subunit ClpX
VSTKNILFICGGAFAGIEKIINDRSETASIGFSVSVRSPDTEKSLTDALKAIQPEDLSKFGLIPEFVGRLPVITCLEEIDEEGMMSILTEPKNAVTKQYQSLFRMDGIELNFTEDALRAIAQVAKKRGTGARGLRSIIEATLQNIMFEMSGTDAERVTITEGTVLNGDDPLIEYRKAA